MGSASFFLDQTQIHHMNDLLSANVIKYLIKSMVEVTLLQTIPNPYDVPFVPQARSWGPYRYNKMINPNQKIAQCLQYIGDHFKHHYPKYSSIYSLDLSHCFQGCSRSLQIYQSSIT